MDHHEQQVAWSAKSPDRYFTGVQATTPVAEFLERLETLVVLGQGHVEVSHADQALPALSVAFRGGFAVVHCFDSEESSSLLVGDPEGSGGEEVALTMPAPSSNRWEISTKKRSSAFRPP